LPDHVESSIMRRMQSILGTLGVHRRLAAVAVAHRRALI